MPPTDTRPRPVLGGRGNRSGVIVGAALAIAIAIAAVAELGPKLSSPGHVATLHLSNPTPYQVSVEVSHGAGGTWLDLGSIEPGQTKTVEEVTDQGPLWVFRFSYGGVDAGRLDLARSELAGAGWSLKLPAEVGERLRTAGLAPSAS